MSESKPQERASARKLDPIYTKDYKHIPLLREKLPWLYSLHPFIKRDYETARELHVAPATFSKWKNGDELGVNPDTIPIEHYRNFLDLWGLPAEILDTEDMAEFRSAIEHFEVGRGPWEKLVRAIPDDLRIEIIAEGTTRGLVDPDEEEEAGVPRFRVGERIMLRVGSLGFRHGVMLELDRSGWTSLRPNALWPETEIDDPMVFPRQRAEGPPRFARLEGSGLHRILAILTAEALPRGVLEILMGKPIDPARLNYIATVIQSRLAAGPDKCQVLSRRLLAFTATG